MLTTETTSFTRDILGRYHCNTFTEASDTDFRRFDVIVIGGGSFGASLATHLFNQDSQKRHRILVLEGGPFFLPEHVQNLPSLNLRTGAATTLEQLRIDWANKFGKPAPVLIDRNDVEPGVEVWGLPWHSRAMVPKDKNYPGLAYCVGGRSLFWGGWSPQLIDSELANWPSSVVADLKNRYFAEASQQLGTDIKNDFIAGDLHEALRNRLFAAMASVTDAVKPFIADELEAPLAVQSAPPRPGFFPFNKFSSVPMLMGAMREAERQSPANNFNKRLMVVPNCHVNKLTLDANERVNGIHTSLGMIPVGTNAIVVLGLGTVESTRLALLSFPNRQNLIGRNLMAHLRSNTTIRIPRATLGPLPNELAASALFVKGSNANGHFHLQITACGVKGDVRDSEAELFKKIPDIDRLAPFQHITDDFIVLTLRGIGEMVPNKTATAPSRIDLDPETDEHGQQRAIITMGLTATDQQLWNDMDMAAQQVATILADGGALQYLNEDSQQWQSAPWIRRDGLGTTHHEGGTLWMGDDPATSVTDTFGRFHEVKNAFVVGPALFPVVGSPNPMLGGTALLRRTGDMLLATAGQPVVEPGFTTLLNDIATDWQMAGPGRFVIDVGEPGIVRSEGGLGLFWYKARTFKNFVLRVDWQASDLNDNSGIFVRFPDPGNDPFVAVQQGYEVQIDEIGQPDRSPLHSTGAIYNVSPGQGTFSRLVGEWNTFEIQAIGQQYTVSLNNQPVNSFVGNRSLEGFIGLQNHHQGSQVRFRNIHIHELL